MATSLFWTLLTHHNVSWRHSCGSAEQPLSHAPIHVQGSRTSVPMDIRGTVCQASPCGTHSAHVILCVRLGCALAMDLVCTKSVYTLENCMINIIKERSWKLKPLCRSSVTALRQLLRQQALAR